MRTMQARMEDAQTLFSFLSDATQGPDIVDFVLAMGSQDLSVADTAAQAFHQKHAKWLICSGGLGKDTTELFHEPEGRLYAKRCQKLGVSEDRLIIEDKATNSGENIQFSRTALADRGIFPKSGVIACKPYMAKRALATGKMQWPEIQWSITRPELTFLEYVNQGNDIHKVLDLMVGDLQRLRVYAGRFQTAVDVPEPIWSAYKRLVTDGYDRFVIQ